MSWAILLGLVALLGLALWVRRFELYATRSKLAERVHARERGSDRARLQYPEIDLSRCIGCGICVEACPEEGVLEIIHGQALVVHGARCVGHGRCAQECPVGAIALTLGDLSGRDDIPVLTEELESTLQPGVFLAGEVTGYALIRTAIAQGTAVADEVARRAEQDGPPDEGVHDLVVVGAGPAGLACSLEALAKGLSFVTLEQEGLGGTVARYPRRKLVMTQPVELPLHGRLERTSYAKEELVELWEDIVSRLELPIRTGQTFVGIERAPEGHLVVRTQTDSFAAHNVCLALGRRGTPRKLGVPGEELPKVAYSLLDAQSYQDRRILVVGGGDSAVEAAMGLAEQPGNQVSLSYRRGAFTRLKARNELRMTRFVEEGLIEVIFESQVERIEPERVVLGVGPEGAARTLELGNDEVFVLAGGVAPTELLRQAGVSFDPRDREPVETAGERGTGLGLALLVGFACSLGALVWAFAFREYYALPQLERPHHELHRWLRPSGLVGLSAGALALLSMSFNLAYLARRSPKVRFEWGSLQAWMTAHVATGLLALVLAVVHSAMLPRHTVGGHALAGLGVLVITGAVGRYLYSFVPRAANGRELALEEAKAELARIASGWDQTHRAFGDRLRAEVQRLVATGHWTGSLLARIGAVIAGQRSLERRLTELGAAGIAEGVPAEQVAELLALARRAYRATLAASHYEDLRGLLASWRYLHRWVALLVVLLVALHVAVALKYATVFAGARP
jgi:thioredoxin reductase/Pyruvate/2-oxoacid:ferredoxin oxidoreductase delta subunit